jgi:hypothetical protein
MAVFILGLGAAAYFSLQPTMKQSQLLAQEEAKAIQMAHRMIEHVQLMRPVDVNYTNLKDLGLIDSSPASSPYSFSNVPLDDATNYSPSKALRNGQGQLSVTPIDAGSVRLDITIAWTSSSGRTRSLTTGAIIGGYR